MPTPTGWHAAPSDPEDAVEGYPFQPFLQTAGCSFDLPVWFQTEEKCQEFIRAYIIGQGELD